MRRQRDIFDMYPEALDLNQGPSFNGLDLNGSDDCNSRLSPTERRLLSNDISGDRNKPQSYGGWDVGESSSRPNVQNHGANNNNNRSTSFGTRDSRFRERQFDHQRVVGSLNLQNYGSNNIPMDVDLNLEYRGNINYDGGPSGADVEASSSWTSNERGSGSFFGINQGQSSSNVGSLEPTNLESSHRYFDQRSTNSSQQSTQHPPLLHVPGMSRNLLPFPYIGTANSRNGSSSSSGFNQDIWSLGNGRSNINGVNGQSSSRNGAHMLPNLNSPTSDQQTSNDVPPWSLFPYLETESGGRRGHFRNFPSGPSSSSDESLLAFGGRNQPRHHQPSLRLEVPDVEWQDLGADIEGRHRLLSEMRQILNVLRRGENLSSEDYMLVDPFINGVADLNDRHRDMRLDVDNMSYEELLALEESIGDVKTGLTDEVILKSLKQRKYFSFMALAGQNFEPCCICQEEYNNGDNIGTLDCGHEFHTCCIKQWLTQKNLCPICKLTGLST
ncbi:hypothetical protein SSX86_009712 [Deinandra increscens subsp. villosa]|uniref:RING-type E3 ubiquitin transferase n=1 Tax=Deinandra increscens subsp. villosa TaxID=3103831 RepID=A0AAP0H3B4_9ASTR